MSEKLTDSEESESERVARKVRRTVTRRSISFGGENRYRVMRAPFPGGLDDPRSHLIEVLAGSVGDDRAIDVVDALDAYLETDPIARSPALQWSPPDHRVERDRAIEERDVAIARAERAERELAETRAPRARRRTKKGEQKP